MDLLSKGPNAAITVFSSPAQRHDSAPLKCARCGATTSKLLSSHETRTGERNVDAVVCSVCRHIVCINCTFVEGDAILQSSPHCMSCVKPLTLTYIFRNTAFGPSLLADVAAYCDPQSERTLKFLFPAVALELARRQQTLQKNGQSHPSTPRSGSTRRVDDATARSPSPATARRKMDTPPKHNGVNTSNVMRSPRHCHGATHAPQTHVSRGREREPMAQRVHDPGMPISTTVSVGAKQQHRTNSRYSTPQRGAPPHAKGALLPQSGPRTSSSTRRPLSARVSPQTHVSHVGSRRATPDGKSANRRLFRQRTADAQLASEMPAVHARDGRSGHPPRVARALLPIRRSPSEGTKIAASGAGARGESPDVPLSRRSHSNSAEARQSANRFSSVPARIKTPRRATEQKKRTATPNTVVSRNLPSDGVTAPSSKHAKQRETAVKSAVVRRGTPRKQTPRQLADPANPRGQKRSATAPRSRILQRTNTYTAISSKEKVALVAQPLKHSIHDQPLVPRCGPRAGEHAHASVPDTDNSSHRTFGGVSHRHAPFAIPPGSRAHHQYINKLLESGALGGTSLLKPSSGSKGKSTTGTSSGQNGSANNKAALNASRRVKGKLPLTRPKGKLAKPKGALKRNQGKKESADVEYVMINGELRALSPMRNTLTPMGTRDSDMSESPAPRFPSFSEYLNEGGSMQQSLFFDHEEPSFAGDETISSPIECGDGDDFTGGSSGPAKVSSVANREDRQLERSNKEYFLTTSENRAGSNDEGAGRAAAAHGAFDTNYVAFQVDDSSEEYHTNGSTRLSSPDPVCVAPESHTVGLEEDPSAGTKRTATSATTAATFTRVDAEHTIHWAMLRKLSSQYALHTSYTYNAPYGNYVTGATTPPQRNYSGPYGDHQSSHAAQNATLTKVMRGPHASTPVASTSETPLKNGDAQASQRSEQTGEHSERSLTPSKPIFITPLDTRALSRMRDEDHRTKTTKANRPRGKSANTDGPARRGRKKDVKSPATKRVCSGPVGVLPSPFKRINSPLRRFNSQADTVPRQPVPAYPLPPPAGSSPLKAEQQAIAGRRAVLSPLRRNQTVHHIQSRPLSARVGARVTSPKERKRPKSEDETARHPSRFLSPATRGVAQVTSPRKARQVPAPLVAPMTSRNRKSNDGKKRGSLTGLAALSGRERGLIASHRVKDAPLASQPLPLVRLHSSAAGLAKMQETKPSAEPKKKKKKGKPIKN